ncbi:MAG: PAS domain S-box protein [Desulfobacula sp.]|jgi:PAS domain S-box-containing protein|uniref:cache domain-containing protein n=1 Tax=Desulfobacula sp. TaxID=2593537 RepID=UPI001DD5901A|nr:PAS domain S-box protein [Desulfobacula sp.]MBT3483894.1 PAS domain S-box protein [Desulfobacula sp.]MBT3803083.1 PAS domain S-box protein [Desulfobacula sp.]MBT4023405.1 PAS domain S-box protein [Desulfobacula sp.]MBT4197131.1 PAS domain S-box protein [Desulfobacula sp.]
MASIKKLLLHNMLFITFISFTCLYFFWVLNEYTKFNEESASVKEKFVASEKERLKTQVQSVLEYVLYMRNQTEKRLRDSIKSRVNEAGSIAMNIYNENKDSKSSDQIKKMIKDALRPIRFNRNRGYYFAFNMEGIAELFADRPEMEGKNMLVVQGAKGEYVVPDMIEILKARKEGFYSYTWSKPGDSDSKHLKIAYVKYFKPFGWGIGTGEYIEDVEKEIQEEVLERISKIRFEKEGYFFGSIYGGQPLFTNGKITKGTKSIWELTDPKGVKLIQEHNRVAKEPGGGFVSYFWQKLDSEKLLPKLSYVVGIPEWEWIIGAGVYLDTMDEVILSKKKALYNDFLKQAVLYFAVMIFISFLILFWTRYQTHKIQSGISLFSNFFETASSQETAIDPIGLQFEEFKSIAEFANQMIETRTKAIQDLRESEEKFRLTFLSSPDSINLNRVKDGIYLEINEGFTKIMGYSREEAIGKSSLDLNIWNDPKDRDRLISLLKKNGTVENLEAEFLGKEGQIKFGLMSARILKIGNEDVILSITRDITERKQMEADRERHLAAIEQVAEGVVIADSDGNIEYVNPAFEKITGYLKQELIGKNSRILKSGEHDKLFYQQMWETIITGNTWNGRLTNRKKNGSFYIEEVTISPVLDKLGKIINFVAIKRDVTDEIMVEKVLQQSQRMESIGTLAGGIAHDFNNILFPIMGYTEMLLMDTPEDSPARASLKEIYTATLRAKGLVKQILTFSRQESSELMLLKIQPIVKEALKLIRSTIPTTIEIKQDINPDCGAIKADPTQIHQIVMNLATNAYHAMEETGGELKVSLKEMEFKTLDLINPDIAPGIYACLRIADTGIGMDKELINKIFDPFFSTKTIGKGTGMGLSVVHGIVTAMGGVIQVYSEPGKGTQFYVYFPIEKNSFEEWNTRAKEPIQGGTEQILLVDDEKAILAMEKRMLERLGYQVTSCSSSLEALDAFRSGPDKFDLIITDMAMPNMPGNKLSAELIKIRPGIPIMLCTGFSEIMSEEKAASLGIKGFILKPIVMKDLFQKIREVLDKN